MNRITAVLLAMAVLLVHVLGVHRDGLGAFAPPFESAHAAYHLGRNLAHEGVLAWNIDPEGATAGGLWSYPSPLLVALAALFERTYMTVTWAAQILGITCVLLTVYLSTRFDTDRIAGVVPALLLVASGAIAASGASGTEWPIAVLLLATAFVGLEHGRSRFAALGLALLVVTRPEGILAAIALAIQTLLRHRMKRRTGAGSGRGRAPTRHHYRIPSMVVFLPAFVTLAIAQALGASLLSDLARIVRPDTATVAQGLHQLRDFMVATISPLLLVFPLVALAMGELSGIGRRALFLALVWCAASVAAGGGPAAFDIAFTPALPIAFIAIQQGIARALDTYRANMERLSWVAIALAIAGSLLASRFPGDLGGLGLRDVQERAWTAAAAPPPGREALIGRSALFSEIRLTVGLRRVGSFLRDRLPEDATVLSPWPGALGYLAGVQVVDLFGRTTMLSPGRRVSWSPEPPIVDLRAALATEPDYIVPTIGGLESLVSGELNDGLPESLFALDPSDGEELRTDVAALLTRYELVVTTGRELDGQLDSRPLLLLRKRGLSKAPTLRFARRRNGIIEFRVGFEPTASGTPVADLPQVYDALVTAIRADGTREILDPTGRPRGTDRPRGQTVPEASVRTIVGVVIDPRWLPAVSLARIPADVLNADPPIVTLEARLLHHRLNPRLPSADAAAPLVLQVR